MDPISKHLSPPSSLQPSPRHLSPAVLSLDQACHLFSSLPLPLSGPAALDLFHQYLPDYEHRELHTYPEVYFLGLKAGKVKTKDFDDQRGDYHVRLWDHLHYRYEILAILGKGSFSQVVKCFDHATHRLCAVKIVRNLPCFTQQAKVETAILRLICTRNSLDNVRIVKFEGDFRFRGHICLVFELLSINIYQLIKKNQFRGFEENLIKRFAAQILISLRFLRKVKVIHCDLKPENVLLKQSDRSSVKLIDFGSACFEGKRLFSYIQSRFYRAPEVILGLEYGAEVDMWSFGCVLAEMALGVPLLQGENEGEMMEMMVKTCGKPPDYMVQLSPKRNLFPVAATHTLEDCQPLTQRLAGYSEGLIDLISCNDYLGCLQWEPSRRLTPDDALQHYWLISP